MRKRPPLKIENVSKSLPEGFIPKKKCIIRDLSLEVERESIFGFLGSNGAGKTTTIKLIVGLLYPDSGSIEIFGESNSSKNAKSRVGFLPENPSFYDYLSGYEFLKFYGELCGISESGLDKRINHVLELVSLTGVSEKQLRKFSKGMKQRIAMAQTLLNDPDLLILDEPMSGLDPIGRREMRDLILDLKERGKSIFFSSHILADAEMICDSVGFLKDGELVGIEKTTGSERREIDSYEVTVSGIGKEDLSDYEIVATKGEDILLRVQSKSKKNKLLNLIREKNGELKNLTSHKYSLEEMFLNKVKK